MKIVLAGDGFVTNKVLRAALEDAGLGAHIVNEVTSPWPDQPMSDFSGVKEAAGDEDELIDALQGADICFSHSFPFSEKVFAACPDLKLVTICRGGPVNVDMDAATRHGVTVAFTPGRNATSTAEHSVAMIMAAARQIAQRDSELKAGEWRGDYYNYNAVGPEISGSTIGVCGYGAVGSRVAKILQAMGAHVMIYDPWVDPEKILPGMERVNSLEEMLPRSDILTLHMRLTKENEHIIGAKEIALLPADAILVNCARGGLLDYDALADALDSGALFAAACDCLPFEPLPEGHRLFTTPRLTMTPHLGGASKQAAHLAASIGATDIAMFIQRGRVEHWANPAHK
ncbi:2-hydroxyacid dehydrogenase [Arcanobacterium haemolyticum]|nr:2-hydroxyacid dehydrogenase [Arcanobacterium haemolyticum]